MHGNGGKSIECATHTTEDKAFQRCRPTLWDGVLLPTVLLISSAFGYGHFKKLLPKKAFTKATRWAPFVLQFHPSIVPVIGFFYTLVYIDDLTLAVPQETAASVASKIYRFGGSIWAVSSMHLTKCNLNVYHWWHFADPMLLSFRTVI